LDGLFLPFATVGVVSASAPEVNRYARPMYAPVRVSTLTISPSLMNSGT
jgi:hypothetical protein